MPQNSNIQNNLFQLLENLNDIAFTVDEQFKLTFFTPKIQIISQLTTLQIKKKKIDQVLSYCNRNSLLQGLSDIDNGISNYYQEEFTVTKNEKTRLKYSLKLKKPFSTLGLEPALIGIVKKIN